MRALEVSERFADGGASEAERERAERIAGGVAFNRVDHPGYDSLDPVTCGLYAVSHTLEGDWTGAAGSAACAAASANGGTQPTPRWNASAIREQSAQAALLRDVLGNPFSTRGVPAAWLTADARAVAEMAYSERLLPSGELDQRRLNVLSDAMEEAGCTDADLLAHLRSSGPHVRGCWALDLILGKR